MADSTPAPAGAGTPRYRFAAALALALLTGLTVLQRLDDALSRMQVPGSSTTTATGLASPSTLLDPAGAVQAVRDWADWDAARAAAGAAGWTATETLRLYALLDVVLVALPLTALLLVLVWPRTSGTVTDSDLALEEEALVAPGVRSAPAAERVPAPVVGPSTADLATIRQYGPLAAVLYLVTDVLEDVALVVLAASPGTVTALTVGALSLAKWLALAGALAVLLVVALQARAARRARPATAARPALLDELVALRAQVLAVLLLVVFVALPGELGQQVDDAVLALDVDRLEAIGATVLATLLLCLFLWTSGRWCLDAYEHPAGPSAAVLTRRRLARTAGAGLVLLVLGAASTVTSLPLIALLVPGLLVLGWAALSLPVLGARPRPVPDCPLQPALLWWLAATPLFAVGLVSIRSGLLAAIADEPGALWFVLAGLVATAAGAVLPLLRRGFRRLDLRRSRWAAGALAAAAVAAGVVGGVLPVQFGGRVGAWAVIVLFCMLLLSVLTGLVLLGDHLPARGVLAVVGFRRVPLVAAFVVCVVATSALDTRWAYHDVRLGEPADAAAGTRTVEEALDAWRAQLPEAEDGAEQPLVLVAAAGGGIRAAYWTAGALSCLWEGTVGDTGGEVAPGTLTLDAADAAGDGCGEPLTEDQRRSFFLASGISGGSVGLAVVRAMDDDPSSYPRALGADFLGSNMAGYVFRDVPNSVLRRLPFSDRAAVMERAWERAVEDAGGDLSCGLLASSYQQEDPCATPDDGADLRFPVLALNSMAIDDGCRLVASPLELGRPGPDDDDPAHDCRALTGLVPSPLTADLEAQDRRQLGATRDVVDHTCADDREGASDLPLSAAAHLSARFPYVSPSGRLRSCADDGGASHALDGGLIESSGAGPVNDLWPTIARKVAEWNADGACVVPRLVLLDNGYASFAAREGGGRPLEALAPLGGIGATFGSRSATARHLAALQVQRTVDDLDCAADVPAVVRVFPLAHPGPQAPLGWTLSSYSKRDLVRELTGPHNLCQYAVVRAWFGSELDEGACRPQTSAGQAALR